MGIWAETKLALNSSLGTDEFLALDKIISKKSYEENAKAVVALNDLMGNAPEDIAVVPWENEIIADSAYASLSLKAFFTHDHLTRIGNDAFNGCHNLTRIEMPDSVAYVGTKAFQNSGIQYVTWSKNCTRILEYTFDNSALKQIYIPEGVDSLEDYCFSRTALTVIHLPSTLQNLRQGVFAESLSLASIIYPGTMDAFMDLGIPDVGQGVNAVLYCSDGQFDIENGVIIYE